MANGDAHVPVGHWFFGAIPVPFPDSTDAAGIGQGPWSAVVGSRSGAKNRAATTKVVKGAGLVTIRTEQRTRDFPIKGCSSIGRALVSKTSGCGFKSLRPCFFASFPR
jgi:hypothetical protein